LPVAMLSVDEAYQRTLNSNASKKSIARIVEAFRWPCFGALLVTQVGAGWKIIDGQHRAEAAKRLQIATVPCIVVPEATAAEQAATFIEINQNRVGVNPYAMFHARVAAGEDLALRMVELLKAAKLSIPRFTPNKKWMKPGETQALKVLEIALQSETSRAAVIAVGHAFEGKIGAVTTVILRAAMIAAERQPAAIPVIQQWLAKHDPEQLRTRYVGVAGIEELAQTMLKGAPAATHYNPFGATSRDRLMAGR